MLLSLLLFSKFAALDRSKFEDPHTTGYYTSNFHVSQNDTYFQLLPNITVNPTFVTGTLFNSRDNVSLIYKIQFYVHEIFRFSLREADACYTRPEVSGVLIHNLKEQRIDVESTNYSAIIRYNKKKLRITFSKFLFEVLDENNNILIEINRHHLFNFEHLPKDPIGERGSRSIGLEFSFRRSSGVYGLPERGSSFRLPMTQFVNIRHYFTFIVLYYHIVFFLISPLQISSPEAPQPLLMNPSDSSTQTSSDMK